MVFPRPIRELRFAFIPGSRVQQRFPVHLVYVVHIYRSEVV